jgi:hypothetical protein
MTVLLVAAGWMFAHTLAWGFLGRFLAVMLQTRGFLSPLNAHLRAFFYLALGVSGHLFVLFIAGATGFFDPVWVSLALVPLSVIGFKGVRASLRFGAFSQVALALFALGYVLQFAIRAPGYWDDTSFHLPIARFYLEQGHFAVAEFLRFPLFPQHMNLLMAQGLSLQGELLAQMLATWPLWLMLLGLYGAALHWLESQLAAFLACVLPFFLLPITSTLGYAYTDLGLSALAFAGALTLMLATQAQGGRRVFLMAGLLLGTAASMKLFGLIWSVGWLALCSAHPVLRRGAGWVVLGMVLTGSFWYLRAFWLSGDPFHPLLGDIVGHYLWSAEDLRGQKAEQASHGVSTGLLPFWEAFSKAGVLWLLPALVSGLFLLRRDRGLGIGWLAFLCYALFWLKVGQVERYLAPALGLGCLLAVVCLWRFGLARALERFYWRLDRLSDRARRPFGVRPLGWRYRAGVIAALQILVLLPPTRADWIDAPARLEAWPQWLVGRKGYSLFEAANQVSLAVPNSALVQVGYENGVYFFKGKCVGDWFGPGRYSQFIVCTDRCRMGPASSVASRVDAFKTPLLLVNTLRFPIDLAGYLPWFEVVSATPEGVLLRRRRDGETPQ